MKIIRLSIISSYSFCMIVIINTSLFSLDSQKNISDKDGCLKCHIEIDYMPSEFNSEDIHMQNGLSCAGCHGGDPNTDDESRAMSKKNNFIGIPEKKDIPNFCGKCHSNIEFMRKFRPGIPTDQVSQFYKSTHGKKLDAGDENVADCIDCHSSHNILKNSDPRSPVYAFNIPKTCDKCHGNDQMMGKYNLRTDQYDEFAESIHGKSLLLNHDLGAPACNDCHGNHGAIPPEVNSISHVCGTCHYNNMKLFENTNMSKSFDEQNFHACEPCHGYHAIKKSSDEMLGSGDESVCAICHIENDEGYLSGVIIKNHLDRLSKSYKQADSAMVDVIIRGMNSDEIEFILKEANQKIIQSRTAVHTFDTTVVAEIANSGQELTNKAFGLIEDEMKEYYRRREGFIYTSVIFFILGLGIFLKIRNIKQKNHQ